eukprot:m.59275 g.59275  ORF g.59275 m.59275 type:complete len:434 (+) comp11234_c0_seq3:188-1489(+)
MNFRQHLNVVVVIYISCIVYTTASCTTEEDCGYNGECVKNTCVCNKHWSGPECQVLNLAPTVREHTGYHVPNTSSWGGSVVVGDDGRLYMYAAEMVAHCGISSWTRNSRVIVASADNTSSPFQFERELFGVFSHEPVATRAPTGEFVIFFTTTIFGCGAYGPCVPNNLCPGKGNSTTCNPGGPTCWTGCNGTAETPKECKDYPSMGQSPYIRFPTYMAYAQHPLGPFSEPVMIFNGSDQSGLKAPATGDTNMAAVILNDGSLVGMWRGDRKQTNHLQTYQYQYRVTATHWKMPATYKWGFAVRENNIFPSLSAGKGETSNCGIEDPSLWLDKNGVIHAVVHNWRGGGHAVSGDRGETWRWFGGNCSSVVGPPSLDWSRSLWPMNVTIGNTLYSPARRERPHIVVNRDGEIIALTTGTQLGGEDLTFTMLQTID